MKEACRLPDVGCRCPQAEIRACAGITTSGLLLPMVANISIDEFQALSKDNAEFTAIDAEPQVDLAASDDGIKQV
jgi:hypothetical protein